MAVDASPTPTEAELLRQFSQAVSLHGAGQVAAAAAIYEQILARIPNHPKVCDLYGTALFQLGAPALGRPYVARALAQKPGLALTWNHLGVIDQALKNNTAASNAFRCAAILEPSNAEPYINLAALVDAETLTAAGLRLNSFALVLAPHSPEATLRQGILLQIGGDSEAAMPILTSCWQRQPGNAEIALHLGRCLIAQGHADRSRQVLRTGIICSPNSVELATSLLNRKTDGDVTSSDIAWAKFATILSPGHPQTWVSRSATHVNSGKPEAALAASIRAILLQPNDSRNLHNFIMGLNTTHSTDLARQVIAWALILAPDDDEVKLFLSDIEFRTGDQRYAWQLWEHRVTGILSQLQRLNMPPFWSGSGDPGNLLVIAEQGVGDEIIFLSCLPELLEQVSTPPVIEVDQRLVTMVKRSFPEVEVIPRQIVHTADGGGYFDYQSITRSAAIDQAFFCGSLPWLRSRRTIAPLDRVGFLRPDPEQVTHWQDWLHSLGPNHKVGVTLRTAKMSLYRAQNHCRLEDVIKLLQQPGCDFINLMPVNQADDAAMVAAGVTVLRPPGLDPWNDLEGLVALMAALDVVISARTANCAFAAAVGVPTIRLAQGFMQLRDDRDYFFANCVPVLGRNERFNGPRVGALAHQMLIDMLAEMGPSQSTNRAPSRSPI